MVQFASYNSPFGPLEIGYEENWIVSIRCCGKENAHSPSPVSDAAYRQLQEYFAKRRSFFDLPIKPQGTPFQLAVWKSLLDIPYGEVRTYKQIAATIRNLKACRVVGQAVNKNPLWIVIPCHRVVGSDGSLTGYAGGLHMKQTLLNLEHTE